jgi:serine/threonine protein kinase
LDAKGRTVVADLGVAKVFSSILSAKEFKGITTQTGTPKWMAPEMLRPDSVIASDVQQIKCDIFSIGLIALYCLDTKEFNKKKENLNKSEAALEEYLNEFRLRFGEKRFFYMLRCMLSYSPRTRPNFEQLYEDFPEFTVLQEGSKTLPQNLNTVSDVIIFPTLIINKFV